MGNWNERVEQARIRALESIRRYSDPATAVLGTAFAVFADALKDPELADTFIANNCIMTDAEGNLVEPRKTQPLVKDPDGRAWRRWINHVHLKTAECTDPNCRPLTFAEAFRPGAIVRWTSHDSDIMIQGIVIKLEAHGYVSYTIGNSENECTLATALTLVKPAKEEESDK